MTYAEIQTIEASGIPYFEYRHQLLLVDDIIITIEFTPKPQSPGSEYHYSQPEFRFGDLVLLKPQLEHCQKHDIPETQLKQFRICAMELVDSLTESGELLSEPRWKYGIRNGAGDLVWLEEEYLVRVTPTNPDWF